VATVRRRARIAAGLAAIAFLVGMIGTVVALIRGGHLGS